MKTMNSFTRICLAVFLACGIPIQALDRPLNFPNPFKLSTGTYIGYSLSEDEDIDLRIYTATGAEVFRKKLVAGVDDGAKSGYNKVLIDTVVLGKNLPTGAYPYILISGNKLVGKGRLVIRPS